MENDRVLGGFVIVSGLNAANMVNASDARFYLARQWHSGVIEVSKARLFYEDGQFTLSAVRLLPKSAAELFMPQPQQVRQFPSGGILSLKKGFPFFCPRNAKKVYVEEEDGHAIVFADSTPVFRVPSPAWDGIEFAEKLSGKISAPLKRGDLLAELGVDMDVEVADGSAMPPRPKRQRPTVEVLKPQTHRQRLRLLAAMPEDVELANKQLQLPELAKHRVMRMLADGELTLSAPCRCTVHAVDGTSVTLVESHSGSKVKIRLPSTARVLFDVGSELHGKEPLAYFVEPHEVLGESFDDLAAMLGRHIYTVIEEFLRVSGETALPQVGVKWVDVRNLSPAALQLARMTEAGPEVWVDLGHDAVQITPGTGYIHIDSIEWPVMMIQDDNIRINFQALRVPTQSASAGCTVPAAC